MKVLKSTLAFFVLLTTLEQVHVYTFEKSRNAGFNDLHQRDKRAIEDYCTVDEDNLIIDCTNINIFSQDAGIKMIVNKCQHPVTVTFQIIVGALGVDWKHDLSSEQDIPIPGFNYQFLGVAKTAVNAKTIIKPHGDKLLLKVSLRANVTVLGKLFSKEVQIFEQNLPFDAKCSQTSASWSNYSTGSKVAIIIGILCIIIIISVVVAVVYRKKGSRVKLFRRSGGGGRGANVMKTVASYHNKQYESDKSNIKVAGKKGPQKFSILHK